MLQHRSTARRCRGTSSETLDGACPIVASFGRRDPLGIGAPARLRKAAGDKGIAADIKVYPDAGHGFANKLRANRYCGSR